MVQSVAPVITVKEARKLLGNLFKDIPDGEIERIIIHLSAIASNYIQFKSL